MLFRSSPKSTEEPMPEWTTSKSGKNVQRVDVVVPPDISKLPIKEQEAYRRLKPEWQAKNRSTTLWQPDNLHEQYPNTLGWAAIQYETVKGEHSPFVGQEFNAAINYLRNQAQNYLDFSHNKTEQSMIKQEVLDRLPRLYAPRHIKDLVKNNEWAKLAKLTFDDFAPEYRVAHIFEVQSRWGQEARRRGVKSTENPVDEYNKYLDDYIQGFHPLVRDSVRQATENLVDPNYSYDPQRMRVLSASAKEQYAQARYERLKGLDKDRPLKSPDEFFREVAGRLEGHPLLKDYNRLILKAAIEQARKEGATHIAISDAETAMMSEGHDVQGKYYGENELYPTKEAALKAGEEWKKDRKSTRLNSSHVSESRMPSSA